MPALCTLQPINPPAQGVFQNGKVARIDISIAADSLADLLNPQNLQSDHEYPADFIWTDGINTDTVRNVGFRLRGNTSRISAKKSFKIKFNHFDSPKFQGLSDLNLNGEHNDPTLLRAKLSWELMRLAGLEAPRASYISLYINGEYKGLYLNVEHIDNDYFETRKKDTEGQIFKCFYGCDFKYAGDSPSAYNSGVYSPENNKEQPDYTTFIAFCKALNAPVDVNYRCNLEKVFDVDSYLRRMAMEILLGHWDNPIFNKNNAYLYNNPTTQRLEVLSYDIDNTFGIDWFGVNWAERNVYSWSPSSQTRPIYTQLMKVSEYKVRFGYYIRTFCTQFFNTAFLTPQIRQLTDLIAPYRKDDVYASYDYGYSYDDFLRSIDAPLGAHAKFGLTDYIANRSSTALSQLQNTQIAPVIENVLSTGTATSLTLQCAVTSTSSVDVTAQIRTPGGSWMTIECRDNGVFPDDVAADNIFTGRLPVAKKELFECVIEAREGTLRSSRWPVCGAFTASAGYNVTPALRINELMADNSTIPDEAGDKDDWLEIYNAGPTDVNLNGRYLTDDAANPQKWPLPPVILSPGGFLLIWADEDAHQGDTHANFKLSKSGEFLGIFDAMANNVAPIDTFTFGAMPTNKTLGRLPDGQGPIIPLASPTPGRSNVLSSTEEGDSIRVDIYPVPFSSVCHVIGLSGNDRLYLTDASGKLVLIEAVRVEDAAELDTSRLASGTYWLIVERGQRMMARQVVKN